MTLIKYQGASSIQEYPYTGVNAMWQPNQVSDIQDTSRITKLLNANAGFSQPDTGGIEVFSSYASLPSPSTFGVGVAQVGGSLYACDGVSWKKIYNQISRKIASGILLGYQSDVVAAGGALAAYEMDAIEYEILNLINSSAWSKLKEIWIPCGSSAAGAYVKLKFDSIAGRSMTASATPPTYSQSVGFTGVPASSTKLITGINPSTNTNFTDKDWGFGVYIANGAYSAKVGSVGGTDAGSFTFIGNPLPGDGINGTGVGTMLQPSGLRSVQIGGGIGQSWFNAHLHASIAVSTSNSNGNINLLSSNSTNYSDSTISGYACWSPSLTKSEFVLLSNFFSNVNRKLKRKSIANSLVVVGDSNTNPTSVGITSTQRWPYLLAKQLGLANVSGAEINNGIGNILMAPFSGQTDYYTSYPTLNSAQQSPPLMIVMLGTNDLGYGVSEGNFRQYYNSWISIQIDAGINPNDMILVSPIWSNNVNGQYITTPAKAIAFGAIVKDIANQNGCYYFDGYAATSGNTGTWFQGDNLHLNVTGHAGFANALLNYIYSINP